MIETFLALVQSGRGWNAVALALGSFCVYALVSNFAARPFFVERFGARQAPRGLVPTTALGIAIELVRFGFYVGVPFLALYMGWIDLRAMGLGVVDWAEGLRWAIVILLAAWLLLIVIWLPYLRATPDVYAAPETSPTFARRMVELIYMQAHWAFYRAAAISLFLPQIIPDNGYWGTACGLALICLEAFSNPRIRQQLAMLGQADSVVWNFGQATINALGFIVTRNFFLLVLIHFLLEVTVPHVRAARPASNLPPRTVPRTREN